MDEYLKLLSMLISLSPVTADVQAVNRAEEAVYAFLRERNVPCIVEIVAERKVLYASTRGETKPDVLLCVHLDVVPADDPKQYEPEVRGGILYGRGANDCLGNAVAAVKILCEAGKELSIGCIFSADEERGGHTTCEMVERGYAAKRAGLVLDAWGGNNIYYAHKGILNVKLTARGRGGHSSAPWSFENPVEKLMAGYLKFAATWENPKNNDDWRCSLAPTVIRGGEVVNRIPDSAELLLNFRTVKREDAETILERLREATGLEVETVGESAPFDAPPDSPELPRLRRAFETGFGAYPGLIRNVGASDARHLQKIGVPVYILGVKGRGCHSREETLDLASVDALVRTVLVYATPL